MTGATGATGSTGASGASGATGAAPAAPSSSDELTAIGDALKEHGLTLTMLLNAVAQSAFGVSILPKPKDASQGGSASAGVNPNASTGNLVNPNPNAAAGPRGHSL